jgi:hypothetical protein
MIPPYTMYVVYPHMQRSMQAPSASLLFPYPPMPLSPAPSTHPALLPSQRTSPARRPHHARPPPQRRRLPPPGPATRPVTSPPAPTRSVLRRRLRRRPVARWRPSRRGPGARRRRGARPGAAAPPPAPRGQGRRPRPQLAGHRLRSRRRRRRRRRPDLHDGEGRPWRCTRRDLGPADFDQRRHMVRWLGSLSVGGIGWLCSGEFCISRKFVGFIIINAGRAAQSDRLYPGGVACGAPANRAWLGRNLRKRDAESHIESCRRRTILYQPKIEYVIEHQLNQQD